MRRLLLVVFVPALIVGSALFVRLPYYAEGPGPTADVESLIHVDGPQTYPSKGKLLLTTVSQSAGRLSPAEMAVAWLDPNTSVLPEDEVVPPGETNEEEIQQAVDQMAESQVSATVVALRQVTDYPKDHGDGALIAYVGPGCPAEGQLDPGSVIVEVAGKPVTDVQETDKAIQSVGQDQPVSFRFQGDGPEVKVTRGECPGTDKPMLGVAFIDNFPFSVKIDDNGIGGPSAGLMWSLGLYDLLTPGDLTEGRTIAGTGAIEADGTVSPIGGVGKKIVAAEKAGADLFLVPDENLAEAKAADPTFPLVPVSSFDEAVMQLTGDTLTAPPKEGT